MMEFVGLLKTKLGEHKGESSYGPWIIAQYLLETVEMYPKKMVVDVSDGSMGRVAIWDSMIGKNVRIYFDIDANEYEGRWYNRVRAFGIKNNEIVGQQAQPEQQPAQTPPPAEQTAFPQSSQGDTLPF